MQSQSELDLSDRHLLIDSLYLAEEFDGLVELIDLQWEQSIGTHWQDSLYLYCYEYGRAIGRAQGGQRAIEATEDYAKRCRDIVSTTDAILGLYHDVSYIQYDYGDLIAALATDSAALQYGLSRTDLPAYRIGKLYANVGFDCHALGRLERGLEMYTKAASYFSITEDAPPKIHHNLASSYNGMLALNWQLGNLEAAEKALKASAQALEGHDDDESNSYRVSTMLNGALLYEDKGEIKKCRDTYEQCIQLCLKSRAGLETPQEREELTYIISKALSNLGALYFSTGQLDISEDYLNRAYALRRTVMEEDDLRLLYINGQRSTLYISRGEYGRAKEMQTAYLEKLIPTYGYNSERTLYAMIDLASTYSYNQEHAQADSMLQLLVSFKENGLESLSNSVMHRVYLRMAESAADQGRPSEAIEFIGKGIDMRAEMNGEEHYQVLNMRIQQAEYLGTAQRYEESIDEFDAIIQILDDRSEGHSELLETEHNPHMLAIALGLKGEVLMANPAADVRQIKEAKEGFDRAMQLVEQKSNLLRGENATLAYFGRVTSIYPKAQSALIALAKGKSDPLLAEEILQIGEKNKTVLLKSRLNAFERLTFSGIPDSLVALEQRLLKRMSEGLIPEDWETAADFPIGDAEEEYRELNALIQKNYPRYHSLRNHSGQISVQEIRKNLLTSGQTLIAYSLVEDGLLAVVIDADSAHVQRVVMEDSNQVFSKYIESSSRPDDGTSEELTADLYEVLFAPIRPYLKGNELLIVPDEELYRINFEQLAAPAQNGEPSRLLIEDFTISYLLSASTALQFGRLDRHTGKGALAVAPGFSDDLKSAYREEHSDTTTQDQQYLRLVQQPFAVSSAEKLGSLLSADVLVGISASEARFKEKAADYDIIHLGTHTEVNDISPLYSKLMLSKIDSSSEDGYLHAFELYDMELKAELAVLTACETGRGGDENGEGIRSLAHGFAYAGCPSVIMSLWEIDEQTTSEIIDSFYGYLAEGVAKNTALRQAKLDFIASNPGRTDPYYWAGLVLIGDVTPVEIGGQGILSSTWLVIGVIVLALFLALYVLTKRRKSAL